MDYKSVMLRWSAALAVLCASVQAAITIEGVDDYDIRSNEVSFRVPSEADSAYTIELRGEPIQTVLSVEPDVWVDVTLPQYYRLSVKRVDTVTSAEEETTIQFIIRSSERESSETGLAPWTPYPLTPSAAAEFAGSHLTIITPQTYPAGLPIPVIAWVEDAEEKRVGVNGQVVAAGFEDYPLELFRGVGSVFLPAASAAVTYTGKIQTLQTTKQITIEEHTIWTPVSGTIGSSVDWGEDARIRITGDLTITQGATLTIGAGSVILIDPEKNIEVAGSVVVNGSRDRPVVFTPQDRAAPWGGFVAEEGTSRIEMTGAILTGSGADDDFVSNSHRHEQPVFSLEDGASATLTDCALVDHAGQAGHGEDATLTMTRCLVQKFITAGQYNGGSVTLRGCALIECPYANAPFVGDEDNDVLYLTDGFHTLEDCLIGWCNDDGIDAGSGADSASIVHVRRCWIEACFHEGFAWSVAGFRRAEDTVNINNGQGIECGHGGDSLNVETHHCLSTANLVGTRYGENYVGWEFESGYVDEDEDPMLVVAGHEMESSFVLYNETDIWGRVWDDDDVWTMRDSFIDEQEDDADDPFDMDMFLHDNLVTEFDAALHPDNTLWDHAVHADELAPFLPVPDGTVGVAIAVWSDRLDTADLPDRLPVRLSTFTRNTVSVDYSITAGAETLRSGTLTFDPGQSVAFIDTRDLGIGASGFARIVLTNPVNAELTGKREVEIIQSAEPVTLIPQGATWKYWDQGSDQGTAWRSTSFDDASWPEGPATLGFGNGGEDTEIEGGTSSNRHPTIYFRTYFTVTKLGTYESVELNLLRDDGAVVYINGEEVLRSNMPSGPIEYTTLASGTVSGDDEEAVHSWELEPSVLISGRNTIAVEVHQVELDSSDLSFALELTATPAPHVPGWFVRGDANGDGAVDISDAIAILLVLFQNEPADCTDSLDVDDNGSMNIADAVNLLMYLFAGGPAPAAPFPVEGNDPTQDDPLDCQR